MKYAVSWKEERGNLLPPLLVMMFNSIIYSYCYCVSVIVQPDANMIVQKHMLRFFIYGAIGYTIGR